MEDNFFIRVLAYLSSRSFIGYVFLMVIIVYPLLYLIALCGSLWVGMKAFWDEFIYCIEDIPEISRDNFDNLCENFKKKE